MPAWLKAGLIGAGILIVSSLIGLVPILGCLKIPLDLVAYAVAGAAAASYMLPPRTAGGAAGQGALAAAVAQLIGGLIGVVINTAATAITGTAANALAAIPPEQLEALEQAGIDPSIFTSSAAIGGVQLVCCGIGIFIAAVVGAIAAAIYASARPGTAA